MTPDLNILGDKDALVALLTQHGARFTSHKDCTCPFHEDHNPSAGVFERDGHWHFKCHTCDASGDYVQVMARIKGIENREVYRALMQDQEGRSPSRRPISRPKPAPAPVSKPNTWNRCGDIQRFWQSKYDRVIRYDYPLPGQPHPEFVIFRCEPGQKGKGKDIYQASRTLDGWTMTKPQGLLPLYNLPTIAEDQDKTVIVCEGEKCVDALRSIDIPRATTSSGGAGKADLTNWAPLYGRNVIIWPDNDVKGREHAQNIYDILKDHAQVKIINPEFTGVEDKGDVVDLIKYMREQGTSDADIRAHIINLLQDAEAPSPSGRLKTALLEMVTGLRRAIPLPWPLLHNATRCLFPGSITVLCGDPGDGKSFLTLQLLTHVICKEGEKACVLYLEDEEEDYTIRLLGQLASKSWIGLYDPKDDPHKVKAPQMLQAFEDHREQIDRVGQHVHVTDKDAVSLQWLGEWVEQQCQSGHKVIIVDPITGATTGESRFTDDLKFVMACRASARRHKARIILVTHPKQGTKQGGLDALAGGAAYSRFTHTVLWIHKTAGFQRYATRVKDPQDSMFGDAGSQRSHCLADRFIKAWKARRGPGQGNAFAMNFNKQSLLYEELGLIEKEDTTDGDDV